MFAANVSETAFVELVVALVAAAALFVFGLRLLYRISNDHEARIRKLERDMLRHHPDIDNGG